MELADDQQAQIAEERLEATGRIVSSGKRSPLVTIVALFYILLWSSAFIATKIGVTHSPPLTLLATRFLCAALLMAVFAWIGKRTWPQGWTAWGRLALFGLLNSAFYLGFNYEAL